MTVERERPLWSGLQELNAIVNQRSSFTICSLQKSVWKILYHKWQCLNTKYTGLTLSITGTHLAKAKKIFKVVYTALWCSNSKCWQAIFAIFNQLFMYILEVKYWFAFYLCCLYLYLPVFAGTCNKNWH